MEKPYFHYDPVNDEVSDEIKREGITIMGVDILPSELPREASKYFGDALLPLLPGLLDEKSTVGAELVSSCITAHGELTEKFKYIDQLKR